MCWLLRRGDIRFPVLAINPTRMPTISRRPGWKTCAHRIVHPFLPSRATRSKHGKPHRDFPVPIDSVLVRFCCIGELIGLIERCFPKEGAIPAELQECERGWLTTLPRLLTDTPPSRLVECPSCFSQTLPMRSKSRNRGSTASQKKRSQALPELCPSRNRPWKRAAASSLRPMGGRRLWTCAR